MKGRFSAAVVAFALANLYLLSLTGPLVSPQHELVFHLPGSAETFFVPAILDVLLVFSVLTGALLLARRSPRGQLFLWSALLLSLPSGLITTIYGFENTTVPLWLGWPVAVLALVAFAAVNLRPKLSLPRFRRARPRIELFLFFLALPELLLFLQLLWYGTQARNLNPPFTPAPMPQGVGRASASPRILWIILDELSYDQVYGHRYPGLALPNFDRLAAQATVFTDAVPTAEYTRRALPSMLTGLPLRRTQPSADGRRLYLYDSTTGKRTLFDPRNTVFADAQRAGLQTAIAGWYEPYCRLLPGVLNRCFWTYSDELPAGLSDNGTTLQHTVEPFIHFLRLSFRPAGIGAVMPTHGALDVRRHRADYVSLLAASDDLLTSGQSGLVMIHMPIPHPWGFYDRKTGEFPDHRTSYLDNLALADAYLGRIRLQLEARGLWENTNVLVMGDHSWRTADVWATSAHWSAEEQAASHHGVYDPRPGYILKLANEQSPARIDDRFDAVRTRSLLGQLMRGSITSPEQLRRWVKESTGPPPQTARSPLSLAPSLSPVR